jgi:hypothetical protein
MIKFGLSYKKHPVPPAIKFWFRVVKRIMGVLGASSVIMEHPYLSLASLIVIGLLDEIQDFFGIETLPTT